MPYPEPFIAPMRAELTRLGVRELRTTADVDQAVAVPGVTMNVGATALTVMLWTPHSTARQRVRWWMAAFVMQ